MVQKMDRRVRRTRRLLSEALLALIVEQGYDSITIQNIVDRADLNRATFYLHYGNKDELLLVALETQFDALVAQLDGVSAENPIWEDETHEALVFRHVAEHADLYKVLLGENGMGYIVSRIITYIATVSREQLERSLPRDTQLNIPAEIVAQHVAGSLFSLLSWWVQNDMPYSPEEMARMCGQLNADGCLLAALTA